MGKGSGSRDSTDYYVRESNSLPDGNTYPLSTFHEAHDQPSYVRSSSKDSTFTTPERHIGPKGLLNLGNTCYANAVLQCLLSTALTHALVDPTASAIFRRYSSNPAILEQGSGSVDSEEALAWEKSATSPRRKSSEHRRKLDDRDVQLNGEWLNRQLNQMSREYHAPEPNNPSSSWLGTSLPKVAAIDPGAITRHPHRLSPCLKPYQQEDAHEFMRALLGTLVNHGHNKELSSLFDGLLESSVVCQTCRRPSLTRDRYMDLSLDIESARIQTLQDALKEFTKTEILTGENKAFCSRCDCKRTATKGLRLATAPTILVTHLKRFAIDQRGRMVRLSKKVKFPQHLEIGDYMSRVNKARPPPYELVAVLVHHGDSCEYGHYIAYVKQCGDWYRCNDSVVEIVDVETVLNQQAYILMYEVAEMREKHGFPSPSKAMKGKSKSRQSKKSDSGFAFSSMLCGMDYDAGMFANVCYYASAFGKQSSKPQHTQRDRTSSDESLDDGIVACDAAATSSKKEIRRNFRRSSSSGNLNRLNAAPTEDGRQSRSVSLHRRHNRMSTFDESGHARIKSSLSPVDGKRQSSARMPSKGELPPRPSATPVHRRPDNEVR